MKRRKLLRLALFVIGAAVMAGLLFVAVLDTVVMPWVVDAPLVVAPDLRGQPLSSAQRRLSDIGLYLSRRDTLYSDQQAPGTVLGQDPPAGQPIKRGRRVYVDVSLGPRYYTVPATISGVSVREAQLQLEASQLRPGEVLPVPSETVPKGVVIGSSPPPGTRLPRGSLVDLEVSDGGSDRPTTVPLLSGLLVAQVEDTLARCALRIGVIRGRLAPEAAPGTVLDQLPAAGSQVLRLTPIDLVIAVEPQPEPQTGLETPLETPAEAPGEEEPR